MNAPKIAVAHYCEGAGHATRMLAVAEELRAASFEVVLAGGGPGTKFVELNGYEVFEPLAVDFIGDYQHGAGLLDVLRHSGPAIVERVKQYRGWLSEEGPELLVTDDISAAMAAALSSQRYVYVCHDPSEFYSNTVERAGAWIRNRIARSTAEQFLIPKVWQGGPMIPGTTAIPPLAPRLNGHVESVDVLVVPSTFTVDTERLKDSLEDRGRDATVVGGSDWEPEASLQPYIAGAQLVVCSGYSTVMESAVAGTPCVILPETSEQRGVAAAVTERTGFYAADSVEGVVDVLDTVEAPASRENGARAVANAVSNSLGRQSAE